MCDPIPTDAGKLQTYKKSGQNFVFNTGLLLSCVEIYSVTSQFLEVLATKSVENLEGLGHFKTCRCDLCLKYWLGQSRAGRLDPVWMFAMLCQSAFQMPILDSRDWITSALPGLET